MIRVLSRRAKTNLTVASDGQSVSIPAGALIHFHVAEINQDERVFGVDAGEIRIDRTYEKGVPMSLMSFGSGPHRCAGEYVALLQTDIFLRRFLAIEGIRIEADPTYHYSEKVGGYELGRFGVSLG